MDVAANNGVMHPWGNAFVVFATVATVATVVVAVNEL